MLSARDAQWYNRCNITMAFRKHNLGRDRGVVSGKKNHIDGGEGEGCHLHLAYLSFAQHQVIKFTLGLSKGPSDAVSAPKAVWHNRNYLLSRMGANMHVKAAMQHFAF